MRILFANHTGLVGGAEDAMLALLAAIGDEHEISVACPDGELARRLAQMQIRRRPLPPVEASFRPHPLHTPAGVVGLGYAGMALASHAKAARADVLYANTTRAALTGAVSRRLGGPPVVLRLHDLLPRTQMGRTVKRVLAATADEVLGISEYVATEFNDGLAQPRAVCVYNGIDLSRFDPAQVRRAPLRDELGLAPDGRLLGQVAQITPWKGQDVAIRTLALLRQAGIDAHLAIVGDVAFRGKQVRYDNQRYRQSLADLVRTLGLRGRVHFLGRRTDIPAVLSALDLSLLPSQQEPFALAVAESLAMGVPAFVRGPSGAAEIVTDGVNGRILMSPRPMVWAGALAEVLRDPSRLQQMRARAPDGVTRFDVKERSAEIIAHLHRHRDPPQS